MLVLCLSFLLYIPMAECDSISYMETEWLDLPVSTIVQTITQLGYEKINLEEGTPSQQYIAYASKNNQNPMQIYVYYDDVFLTRGVSLVFSPDMNTFRNVFDSYSVLFGDPTITSGKEIGEELQWKTESAIYTLSLAGTLDEAKNGKAPFALLIQKQDLITAKDEEPTTTPTPTFPLFPYNEPIWINMTITEAIQQLTERKYEKAEPSNAFPDFKAYENKNEPVERIFLAFDEETFYVTNVAMYCKADKSAKDTVSSLNELYGDSIKGLAPSLGGNSFFWFGDKYAYVINSEGSLEDVVDGKQQYAFIVSSNNTNTSEESADNKPTPSPQPTAKITSEITVKSARLERNSAGTDLAYISLRNNSRYPVDRVDFYVKCFDAYNNQIKGYGIYDVSSCFYDEVIQAYSYVDSDIYWGLYGFTGTKWIEVAIISYHFCNGETVIIPEDQLQWKSFK